jgi:hypothetical protein
MPAARSTRTKPKSESAVTAEQMASMEFEPWSRSPGEWEPPTNAQWEQYWKVWLPTLRLAWTCMYKTKAGLEELSITLEDRAFGTLLENISSARFAFQGFHAILLAAEGRLMIAAASADQEANRPSRGGRLK